MGVPEVEGATGYIDTNFEGKAQAAVDEWKNGKDLVYIHIEAPDECGHRNEPEIKSAQLSLSTRECFPLFSITSTTAARITKS